MSKDTDEEIVKKIIETERHDLFGLLYDRYQTKVYHKCLSFSKDSDDAKDMLHDIFLKVFTSLSSFSGRSSFATWLYSITYNFCVDYARHKTKFRTQDIDDSLEVNDKADEVNEAELMGMQSERLKKVLENIDPKSKMILLMKFQDGFSIKQIMEMTDLSESAIKMRVKRAKAQALAVYNDLFAEA